MRTSTTLLVIGLVVVGYLLSMPFAILMTTYGSPAVRSVGKIYCKPAVALGYAYDPYGQYLIAGCRKFGMLEPSVYHPRH